jgi:hypothetical protein
MPSASETSRSAGKNVAAPSYADMSDESGRNDPPVEPDHWLPEKLAPSADPKIWKKSWLRWVSSRRL